MSFSCVCHKCTGIVLVSVFIALSVVCYAVEDISVRGQSSKDGVLIKAQEKS